MNESNSVPSQLVPYPSIIQIPIAWGDMDAFGHVNNVNFFRYFESARVNYFDEVQLLEQMKLTGIGAVVGSTDCRYFLPIKYPDSIWVGSRISKMSATSFIMEYEIVSQTKMKTCAKGSAKMVMFDFNKNQKVAIPEQLRNAIEQIESKPSCLANR